MPNEPQPSPLSWGKRLIDDIESGKLSTSARVEMDIDDPVKWVKELRQQEFDQRASRI